MILPKVGHVLVQYDEPLRLMRFQWLADTSSPNSTQLRPDLKYGRDLVCEYQPLQAVVDLHGLPDLSMADQLWMTAKWLPRIARQSLQRATIVLPDATTTTHNQMAAEAALWATRRLVHFDVQFFMDVASALDWTTESSPRIPLLEAEWARACADNMVR